MQDASDFDRADADVVASQMTAPNSGYLQLIPAGFKFQPRRFDCEVSYCRNPALPRKLFEDAEGFWTWLCEHHRNRMVGWHD